MKTQIENSINTIFVDCFSTIIFRNIKPKNVFKMWAKDLSKKFIRKPIRKSEKRNNTII